MDVEVIVEIPKGSRNKYEMDHDTGARSGSIATSSPPPRTRPTTGSSPTPSARTATRSMRCVLLDEPTFPGCHIMVRPIGVFWMSDEKGPDAKVLCVPARDPRWCHIGDLDDLLPHLLAGDHATSSRSTRRSSRNKDTEVRNWEGATAAIAEIDASRKRYVPHDGH